MHSWEFMDLRRSSARLLRCVTLASVAALGLSACASSSSGGSGTTSTAHLSAVSAAVKSDQAIPEWKAPGPAVDAAKLKGKSIFVIPITSGSAFEAQVEAAEKKAAKAAGVKLTFYSNQGTVAEWVQGMNAAIAAKPDLIFLQSAPDPRQLKPQLAAAKKAGIPVVASHIWDAADPNAPACEGCEGLTAVVKGPFREAGRMTADWVIHDSKGKADVLMVGIQGINSGDEVLSAAKAEYKKNCPGCKVKVVSLTLNQISDGAIQAVSSALTSDPKINYVVPSFDILIAGSVASMNTSNRASGTKVVSFGGTTSAMAAVADPKSPMAADVAEPIAWTAYANLDQAFRILAGMQPVQEATPARVFDKKNISQSGGAPNFADGFGSDYTSSFMKLWNLEQ